MTFRQQALLLVLTLLVFIAADLWLGGQPKDWVRPERALTAISVLAGFVVLSWQLNRQHANALKAEAVKAKNALEADARKARNELRLSIYREIGGVAESASREINTMQRVFFGLKGRFFMQRQFNHSLHAEADSFAVLQGAISAAQDSIIAVMAALEKWEIAIGPDFQAFKAAFSEHSSAVGAAYGDALNATSPYLPPIALRPPDAQTYDKIDATLEQVSDCGMDLICDLWDLRIALQNRLLGGLFEWRVPPRAPGDPSIRPTILP